MFELRGGFCKKTEKTNYVILNLERKTNCNCEGPNADKLRNIILLRKKCREDFAKKKQRERLLEELCGKAAFPRENQGAKYSNLNGKKIREMEE
jgi:hypothetical protein